MDSQSRRRHASASHQVPDFTRDGRESDSGENEADYPDEEDAERRLAIAGPILGTNRQDREQADERNRNKDRGKADQ